MIYVGYDARFKNKQNINDHASWSKNNHPMTKSRRDENYFRPRRAYCYDREENINTDTFPKANCTINEMGTEITKINYTVTAFFHKKKKTFSQ